MLLGQFYNIISQEEVGESFKITFELNASHQIFKGHFPGHPVVPGVCMMQMVKETLENRIGRKLMIEKATQMKFLSIINPVQSPVVALELKYNNTESGKLAVSANIFDQDRVYFKFNGIIL